eukprot:TRINITY_DN88_c0_g3_i2.p1 TRINITY_DN88_c0_g3~~TRINITY_DN88_c0_g3_i2.p1  ORF type:complete len:395 (+),score=58.16 TRINITY_DN88_c0_g3_i2:171-1187(+)
MYANLKRRFNFAVGVGREFGVTNGILQGCPISVLLINGLMSILFSCVEEETGADSVSYADDAYLLAMLEETLQEATDKVIEFNTYTGGLMNNEKTKTFSTVEDARHQIRGEGGAPLEMMDIVKTLGVQLRARGPDTQLKKQLGEKLKRAVKTMKRLEHMPLDFANRAEVIAASLHPSYLHGAAFDPAMTSELKKLTTATATAVWGRKFMMRSPGAVLSFALPSHTCHPLGFAMYNAVGTMTRLWAKSEEHLARARSLRDVYERHPEGPGGGAGSGRVPTATMAAGIEMDMGKYRGSSGGFPREQAAHDTRCGQTGNCGTDMLRQAVIQRCRKRCRPRD